MSEAVPWDEAVEILAAAVVELPDDGFTPTVSSTDPRLGAAAISLMRQLYTRIGEGSVDPAVADLTSLDERASIVIAQDDGLRAEFAESVLFAVRAPTLYSGLAPTIRWVTTIDGLTDSIISHLRHGTDLERANALDMQYYLFGRPNDRKLGDERRVRIEAAVDSLRADDQIGELTEQALGRFTVPSDALT